MKANYRIIKKYGYLEGWLSLIVNVLLFVVKYWAGVITGSVALIADAWHTLSDSLTSIIVLIGIKASVKPPDKRHPYGHGRAELIGSIVIGVLLAIVGFNFLIEAIEKLQNRHSVVFGTFAIVVTIISVVVKEAMAQFAIRTGKKHNIKTLIADGWHHRSDSISSIIILVGIYLNDYFWWMDAVLGIIVAILIFYTTFHILKDNISPLLGEKPNDEIIDNINKIAQTICERELNVHHIRMHQYGHHTELTFHIELPGNFELNKAHTVASRIEQRILKEMGIYSTIHMEPIGTFSLMENVKVISFNYSDNDNFNFANDIRTKVFVEEQKVDHKLEFDGLDDISTHYLVFYNKIPVATARWRETDEGIKLERFAVLTDYRNKGIAKLILEKVLEETLPLNKKIYLNSQVSAVKFYQKYGFNTIGDMFMEADIEHYKMEYKK